MERSIRRLRPRGASVDVNLLRTVLQPDIIPENVRLVFFPPHSPELNPIKRFWEDLKDRISLGLRQTPSELKNRVSEKLHSYIDEAATSLTRY
jgi:transposase